MKLDQSRHFSYRSDPGSGWCCTLGHKVIGHKVMRSQVMWLTAPTAWSLLGCSYWAEPRSCRRRRASEEDSPPPRRWCWGGTTWEEKHLSHLEPNTAAFTLKRWEQRAELQLHHLTRLLLLLFTVYGRLSANKLLLRRRSDRLSCH